MTAVEPVVTSPRRGTARPRPGRGARRVGHLVAAGVNALLLVLVNARPGWDAVPFLTDDTPLVLDAVNASIAVGLLANLVHVVADPREVRALGDAVTTAFGLYATVRVWQVFPFDVSDGWDTVLRVLLALGVVGSAIALVRLLCGR